MAKSSPSAATQSLAFRHGDVDLIPVDPKTVKVAEVLYEGPEYIIAYGEVTGHHHKLVGKTRGKQKSSVRVIKGTDGKVYIQTVGGPVSLTHQEHSTLTLDADSMFRQEQEQEYDPFAERLRAVRD